MSFTFKLLFYLTIFAILSLAPQQAQADDVDFKRDIAPILEERCWYCHGEDEQESGLRLDRRVKMLRGGDSGLSAVVPGKPEKSYLIEVVKHLDPDVKMPPDEDKIPDKEIDLLTRWIKEGAVWPGQMEAAKKVRSDHWSFQPVVRFDVPNVETESRNPIDAFLLKSLTEHGLSFSQPADPRSIIRRVSIVLTGLPPTPKRDGCVSSNMGEGVRQGLRRCWLTDCSTRPTLANDGHSIGWTSFAGPKRTARKQISTARTLGSIATTSCAHSTKTSRTISLSKNKSRATR